MGEGPGVHLSNASDYWHDDLWVVDTETLESRQISLRNSRRLATAMRSSRLPGLKTLADFDFSSSLRSGGSRSTRCTSSASWSARECRVPRSG